VRSYSADLAAKPHCVVFTKMDLLGEDDAPPIEAPDAFGVFAISSAARQGLEPLIDAWWRRLLEMKQLSLRAERDVVLP
jgi:GTPase